LKRPKILLGLLVTLALVLPVVMAVPGPVMAAEISMNKSVVPAAPNIYKVGDTIDYDLSVTNTHASVNMTIDIYDIEPGGSPTVLLEDDITILPLATWDYYTVNGDYYKYVVDQADIIPSTGVSPPTSWRVVNTLHAYGWQGYDEVNISVTMTSFIEDPDIDIEKYVSVDGGTTWLDADTAAAGPYTTVGSDVKFKVVVTNTGGTNLVNVAVSDTDFTFTGVATSLAVGAYDESDVLTVSGVAGQHYDLATVTGDFYTGATFRETVSDNDPAYYKGVDARITISPNDTNKVGDSHDFTVYVEENDGTGWADASGVSITGVIASGPGSITSTNPDTTDANGEMVITITSSTPGVTEVDASGTVTVGGIPILVETDGYGAHDIDNEKTWVDAHISIVESGTNPVNTPHNFTVTVEKNDGTGWVAADGVSVLGSTNFGTITSLNPDTTDSAGQMTITVNSATPGTATVHASSTVTVSDIPILVDTNGYGAYTVYNTKTWTDGNGGGYSCSCCDVCELTVDWEGCITSEPLYCSNDKLAVDLLGPSFDLSHNLFLEQGTHAPVVGMTTYYLIVIRELEVQDIPPLPENTVATIAVNVTPVDAIFDRDIFMTLGVVGQLPENTLNVTMNYYDDVNGIWVPLDYEAGGPSGPAALTLTAPINHFSIFGVLAEIEPTTPPQPAHFVASGLNIVPSVEKTVFVTTTGESATITANVANDGEQEGTYTVQLKLNGEIVDTKTVTLDAGQSQQVSFTVSGLDYGQYEVDVAGLSGDFTTSRAIAWWLIILLIVVFGLIVWGVVWGVRRRRRAA
jgi:hypothetical protein